MHQIDSFLGTSSMTLDRTLMDRQTRSFSDLPHELLSDISKRLGLIDLLCFRSLCKNTRSASFDSSAAIEQFFSQCNPWFLLYGDGPNCSIVTNTYKNNKRYNINLPEIADSTCVASLAGWLLFLSSDSSMFFFCPFSKSRINLPNCPFNSTDSDFAAAAFSHSPTNRDCAVVVLRREYHFYNNMEIWLLRRGESEWCKYEHYRSYTEFGTVKSVLYHEETFNFLDSNQGVVIFNVEMKTWSMNFTVPVRNRDHGEDTNIVILEKMRNRFGLKSKEMKSILGIQEEEECTITICGTLVLKKGSKYRLIEHEMYSDGNSGTHGRQLKGVWIEPRFHQIPLNQSWSL